MSTLSWAWQQLIPDTIWINAAEKAFDSLNFSSFSQSGGFYEAFKRSSDAAQNDYVTFAPRYFRAGTYAFVLLHVSGTDAGIYTVSISTDNSAWTDLGVYDGYAASAGAARAELTGLTIAEGRYYVRLKMATKNASSSAYRGNVSGLGFTRTGA